MSLLLVDDRDGKVVTELASREEALELLASLSRNDMPALDHLCVVEFQDHPGAIVGTASSVTIRSL
jgi:hypothetical protein